MNTHTLGGGFGFGLHAGNIKPNRLIELSDEYFESPNSPVTSVNFTLDIPQSCDGAVVIIQISDLQDATVPAETVTIGGQACVINEAAYSRTSGNALCALGCTKNLPLTGTQTLTISSTRTFTKVVATVQYLKGYTNIVTSDSFAENGVNNASGNNTMSITRAPGADAQVSYGIAVFGNGLGWDSITKATHWNDSQNELRHTGVFTRTNTLTAFYRTVNTDQNRTSHTDTWRAESNGSADNNDYEQVLLNLSISGIGL